MSRSRHTSPRPRYHLHGGFKRARVATARVLRGELGVPALSEVEALVRADQLEERGQLVQAEALRAESEDALLPVVPGGFNTRLRW